MRNLYIWYVPQDGHDADGWWHCVATVYGNEDQGILERALTFAGIRHKFEPMQPPNTRLTAS